MDYGFLFRGISVAYLEKMETVPRRCSKFIRRSPRAVPRFFEKMYANILEKGHRETGLKRAIFDWALRVAAKAVPWRAYGREVPSAVKLQWRIADKLVYSKIREGVGGRIRNFVVRRRAACAGAGGIFLVGESAGVSGIRADGDFADRHRESAAGQ